MASLDMASLKESSMKRIGMFALVAGVFVVLLAGCGGAQAPTTPRPAAAPAGGGPLPAGLILAAAPAGAKDVIVLKKDAKENDEVVVRGIIGGREKTFVSGFAMFTIADAGMTSCNLRPGDKCPAPWDFCCETDLPKKIVTIQIPGPDGKPLKMNVQGSNGLDHLAVVIVKGKVEKKDAEGNLIINASGIFIEKPAPMLAEK